MFRLLAGGFALALLALAGPAPAEDKKDKDKVTTWTREINGIDLRFEFGKGTGKIRVDTADNALILEVKLKTEKDVVSVEITDVEVKGNFPNTAKKGDKFSFKWEVKDGVATLSDLKGENVEEAKRVVEGEYKLKK